MHPSIRSRRLLPLAVVLALVAGSGAPAAASAPTALAGGIGTAPGGVGERAGAGHGTGSHGKSAAVATRAVSRVSRSTAEATRVVRRTGSRQLPFLAGLAAPARIAVPAAPVQAVSKVQAVGGSCGTARSGSGGASYRGVNHVWIPSLGMSRSISFYACSRNTALAHVVYRWGCAGTNNVYLMGHASSVMRPLHDAYYSGRLKVGMRAIYADGNGRVRTYAVSFWRVVRPDGDIGWAYASQSRASMTLQTCIGSNSTHRLVVRLVAVN